MGWQLERRAGTASALHADSASAVAEPAAERHLMVMEAEAPAIVLGSTQPEQHIDLALAEREGIEVARRRSGGGAVLVTRQAVLWVDLIVPAGDELWEDDVGKAAWWVGDAWAGAVRSLHVDGQISVWKDRLRSTDWSSRVCFAGVGPGEVLIDGRKVVGVSQRRTRSAALFQTAALLEWMPAELLRLLALDAASRRRAGDEVGSAALGLGRSPAELLDAFLANLPA